MEVNIVGLWKVLMRYKSFRGWCCGGEVQFGKFEALYIKEYY